ncbi:MAG: ribosome maturation factor RimM [Anaerolineae bacterium]|jgi:16S rRNA processing protein RimM|nr:ribosome maturation factor RimM [Anaerolineae bacterium]
MAKAKEKKSYLAIGKIVGPHGIRGEVKVEPMTDFAERFAAGGAAFLGLQTGVTEAEPVTIAAARPHQGRWLVLFGHIKDRNAAETLRDQYVLIPEESAMPLGEHENYAHDLIGLDVVTSDGQELGKLIEILFTPANDVYITRGERGETLIPATREVILSVDLPARRMIVALPEGLLAPASEEDADE